MYSINLDYETGEVTFVPDPVPGEVVLNLPQQRHLRNISFTQEADPLFFKWQAGEATKEEWMAKREEIRDRYPYPEDIAQSNVNLTASSVLTGGGDSVTVNLDNGE